VHFTHSVVSLVCQQLCLVGLCSSVMPLCQPYIELLKEGSPRRSGGPNLALYYLFKK
jgi:hypothetical protein